MTQVASVRNLSICYRDPNGETVAVVKDVSFDVNEGETVGIVGESGSGKSQLMLSLMRLNGDHASVTGSIRLVGEEITTLPDRGVRQLRGDRISMIFQNPQSCLTPHLRIGTQLVEAVQTHIPIPKADARSLALAMLKSVRIQEPGLRMRQYPHELSGGMQQRIMIAMALLCNPQLLIADEPTTALDMTAQAEVLGLLSRINRERGLSIILISHSFGVIASLCERVIVMYRGRIVETGSIDDVFGSPAHPYTRLLVGLACGEPPKRFLPAVFHASATSGGAVVSGCPYASKCPQAGDLCRKEYPRRSSGEHAFWCHYPQSGRR